MGAPTWPPDADAARTAGHGNTEEETERAMLRAFLFGNPPRQLGDAEVGTTLWSQQRRLDAWLKMISQRNAQLLPGSPAGTDGSILFLPPALPLPVAPESDAALYRVMAVLQLGMLDGGFLEDRALLRELLNDWILRSTYTLLACQWVLQHWTERFPGLRRDLSVVSVMESAGRLRVNLTEVPRDGLPHAFIPLYDRLTLCLNWPKPDSTGDHAQAAISKVRSATTPEAARLIVGGQAHQLSRHFRSLRLGPPPVPEYCGLIRPEWILGEEARAQETSEDWKKGQIPLRRLRKALARKDQADIRRRFKDKLREKMLSPELGDVGKMPAYGPARDAARAEVKETGPKHWTPDSSYTSLTDQIGDLASTEGNFHPEWDHQRRGYRVHATRVLIQTSDTGPIENYDTIVNQHRKELAQIRDRFERLRVEERWVGAQQDGPELDLAAVIRARTDIAANHPPRQNIYRRFIRQRRDLCVLTLVDLSGSTKGAVLYEQQRSIVLFSEALRTLQLPHAFYGFNGAGPKQCHFHQLKGFQEEYDDTIKRRLGNLKATGGTRLGAHLREARRLLAQQPQGRRLLLLLSDGRPEEQGEYRGQYGVEDSAMAVHEGHQSGLNIHCISMDDSSEAPKYLNRIFGAGQFHLVPEVAQLPNRLSEVFRNLLK